MTELERTAQSFRVVTVPHQPAQCRRKQMISGRFLLLAGLVLGAIEPACSEGESGLVLGRPLPSASGASSVLPSSGGAGGELPSGGAGMLPSGGGAGDAQAGGSDGGGQQPAAGEAGAGGMEDPGDPAWIEELCTPVVTFENRAPTEQAQVFTDAVPQPSPLVQTAAHAACRSLFRSASEVKAVSGISLVVEDFAGAAEMSGSSIRISSSHLKSQSDDGRSVHDETLGLLHFTTSLVYQNYAGPVWLVTGIADFVRLSAGLIDPAARMKGGTHDESSKTTAFFLEYLHGRDPEIVYRLNQRLADSQPAWSDDAFVELTGSDLATLWSDYQATLP